MLMIIMMPTADNFNKHRAKKVAKNFSLSLVPEALPTIIEDDLLPLNV